MLSLFIGAIVMVWKLRAVVLDADTSKANLLQRFVHFNNFDPSSVRQMLRKRNLLKDALGDVEEKEDYSPI